MSAQHFTKDASTTYEAPLHFGDSDDRIADEYTVYLKFGYTLEQHKRTVGLKSESIQTVYDRLLRTGQICYAARLDEAMLAAVRADVGVEMVECDVCGHDEDGEDEGA